MKKIDFNKTKFGKFMSVISVLSCILVIIGLSFAVVEAIVYAKDLDVDKYQLIIDLSDVCMRYAFMFIFVVVSPGTLILKDYKNLNKPSIKNKVLIFKTLIVILGVIYIINLVYDIGFVIGQFVAR